MINDVSTFYTNRSRIERSLSERASSPKPLTIVGGYTDSLESWTLTPESIPGILVTMTHSIAESETIVRTEILRCIPEARCFCIFGSLARQNVRPFSDIDIGLSTDTDPDFLTLGDAAGAIEAETGRPVDIILLRGLPERDPELAYRIADEGILLYERNRFDYAHFKKRAFLYYLDTEYLRTLNRRALHHRILSDAMGRRNYV